MKRLFTLIIIIAANLLSFSANSQTTYVNNGTSANYTLYTGDSLSILSGTYTGTISNWQQGAKISVASGATFNPNNFGYFLGRIYVYGTANLTSINGQTNTFRLINYGTLNVIGDTYLGGSATLENNYGATTTFIGGININGSTLINNGTMLAKGEWYAGSSSVVTNNNLLTVEGNLQINGSTANNGGKLYTKKKLSLSGATYNNTCRTIADATIEISTSTVNNDGLFWASNAANNSMITNGGTIIGTTNSRIKSVNFNNNGTISGNGYMYFTGVTTNNGGAKIGKTGTTTDSIRVYDASRSSSIAIFDNQYGTIYANVKYVVFAAPDTIYPYPSCSTSYYSMMAVLPVKWNYFYVNLSNNIPAIAWSSEQDAGTFFEIQRSYDGSNFSSVTVIASQTAATKYIYNDRDVNAQAAIAYYRIKAIEPTGSEKFTEIRALRFTNKQGIAVQMAPNPFTSQFSINYQSDDKGMLVIKLYSISGQLQSTKNVSVGKGFNSIAITEAAPLPKGIYMLQLTMDNKIIASEKIVKQ